MLCYSVGRLTPTPLELNELENQVILGSLLGDGSLNLPRNWPYFHERKKEAHHDYLKWKSQVLTRFSPKVVPPKKGGFPGSSTMVGFRTLCSPAFMPYYWDFYGSGTKRVPPLQALNHVGPLALAVWYMDDGSLSGGSGGSALTLHTEGFSLEDQLILQRWFEENWSLFSKVHPIKRKEISLYQLKMYGNSMRRFLKVTELFIQPIMRYKWDRKKIGGE